MHTISFSFFCVLPAAYLSDALATPAVGVCTHHDTVGGVSSLPQTSMVQPLLSEFVFRTVMAAGPATTSDQASSSGATESNSGKNAALIGGTFGPPALICKALSVRWLPFLLSSWLSSL